MTIKKILIEPDPILRKKCEPLEKVDDQVRNLMKDMFETMYNAGYWVGGCPSRCSQKIDRY